VNLLGRSTLLLAFTALVNLFRFLSRKRSGTTKKPGKFQAVSLVRPFSKRI